MRSTRSKIRHINTRSGRGSDGLLRLADTHPAVLRLPRVQGVFADAYFSRHVLRFAASLYLLSAAIICASVCWLRDILLPGSLPSAKCQNHTHTYANLGEQISVTFNFRTQEYVK